MTVVAGEENAGVVLTDGSNSCSISGNYVTRLQTHNGSLEQVEKS